MLMESYSSELGGKQSTSGGNFRAESKQSFASPSEEGRNLMRNRSSFKALKNHGIISQSDIVHPGQIGMKEDMIFGWRPDFNDKERLHRKEAIAIKLNYPNNPNLFKTSIRANVNMLAEMYRNNKSKCRLLFRLCTDFLSRL